MEKTFIIDGNEVKVSNFIQNGEELSFSFNGKNYSYSVSSKNGSSSILSFEGSRLASAVSQSNKDGEAMVIVSGIEGIVSELNKRTKKKAAVAGSLVSPMPGKIFKILKEVGSEVKKGEPILILEAMKMEHSIRSDKDGTVGKIHFQVGELVQGGVILAEVGSA